MTELESLVNQFSSPARPMENDRALALRILSEAENELNLAEKGRMSRSDWLHWLETTRKPSYLQALGSDAERIRWTDVVFSVLQHTGYGLLDMIQHRVNEHPDHILFRDMTSASAVDWSYDQIYRHLREIAALFLITNPAPRVAIYTENCLEGACADLACLSYGLYNTPLSPHFKADVLVHVFDLLNINIALADTPERVALLTQVRSKTAKGFDIFSLLPLSSAMPEFSYLVEAGKNISLGEIGNILDNLDLPPTEAVATTMFTSGSTGLPKGVSFSLYNIISKRFARAAALPDVGDEVFICYLPLFHTFGRYLELTGSIFWNGTYIFAGNTSSETLLSLFPRMEPTGFISIPLRWQELYERCQEKIRSIENHDLRAKAVREVVGDRLHWGLSAAGYLDPAVFRFFNQFGIHLNSGFGMTEATGGITMTPPGRYREYSVGIPLPGVKTRLTENAELELSGHYIGRYLEQAGPGQVIPYPIDPDTAHWMPTGDVFKISQDGFFQIVDRVKDIYKNNRGQTVAPQVIEKKFYKVPAIKSVFLVGDNRPYNVLLIVPDKEDPVFGSLKGNNLTEYYHQIIMTANADVAPFERVINFTLLDRDFSRDRGELTPKDSFNRKVIEANFHELIESLYQGNTVSIEAGAFSIVIPKWFFRDLGILETDIIYRRHSLVNKVSKKKLLLKKVKDGRYQVGHFLYHIDSNQVDLGLFSRQPAMWTGNLSLIDFCPVKEGWDLSLGPVFPSIAATGFNVEKQPFTSIKTVKDQLLIVANNLIFTTYWGERSASHAAAEELGNLMASAEPRLANAIRMRIEALAFHPDEEMRCLAYRIILLQSPRPEDIRSMPSFIASGLSFLNADSIRKIAASNFGKHRLDALKQRLYHYRTDLEWPANAKHRRAFESVLTLLYDFAILHMEYYVPVRAELSRWILHKKDPYLSRKAEKLFNRLALNFEERIERQSVKHDDALWRSKLVFENVIPGDEQQRIINIFKSTTFLEESILLTFKEQEFHLPDVPNRGIWILRLLAFKEFKHYRLSVNTTSGKHYDLHMVMSENPRFRPRPDTFYWLASLAGFPYGPAVAPMLGSSRPSLGVLTTQYIGGLTAWDKIRELSEIHRASGIVRGNAWKKIFIKAFCVIFKAWHHSGMQIVPGTISPANVSIPEMDFRESAVMLSLAGWTEYKGTLSLVEPMLQDFYCRTSSLYPWCRNHLDVSWIFDACIEALGREEAAVFLTKLNTEAGETELKCFDSSDLKEHLVTYLSEMAGKHYLPVSLFSAIDQYQEWYRMNPLTTVEAKEQTINELLELYKLRADLELVRYFFYRHTYFSDAAEEIQEAFDLLLRRMQQINAGLAIQLTELSDLQSVMKNPDDRSLFNRMVFPRLHGEMGIDFVKIGESRQEHIVVRFTFTDRTGKRYTLREPVEPRETGQLYQLFFRERYPKEITAYDHQYILTDDSERIVGGLTYRFIEDRNILLDGIVVNSALQGKGIASAMLDKFFASMAVRGIEVIKAHFLFGNYYLKHLFDVDKKWGALVKRLN